MANLKNLRYSRNF